AARRGDARPGDFECALRHLLDLRGLDHALDDDPALAPVLLALFVRQLHVARLLTAPAAWTVSMPSARRTGAPGPPCPAAGASGRHRSASGTAVPSHRSRTRGETRSAGRLRSARSRSRPANGP